MRHWGQEIYLEYIVRADKHRSHKIGHAHLTLILRALEGSRDQSISYHFHSKPHLVSVTFKLLYFSLLPRTILYQPVVWYFLFRIMEKSFTEQDREIRDMVKRADKNLDRTGAFVRSPHRGIQT
jgi:hypothetical protein